MDLQGDEELEALRLAALATLKSKKKEFESFSDNISKVSTLITSKCTDQQADNSQGSAYGNKASWRNSQLTRRGRGRQFPKVNQRSNLIVITPVNLGKKTDEKETLPQLVLPQHKWCQSVNEDSSSPKSYRRVGPTRFNRHGSDSESSDDSDYDNSDDNDSYSNDTVLQDEPSEHFSTLTPEENTEDERLVEKKKTTSERRLSFHRVDSQEKKKESANNSKKDSYPNSPQEDTKTYKTVAKEKESKLEKDFSDNPCSVNSVSDELVPKKRSHSPIQFQKSQSSSISENGGLHSKKDNISKNHISLEKDSYKHSRKQSDKRTENNSLQVVLMNDLINSNKNLSKGDLRYELKKRMQEKPLKADASRTQNDSSNLHSTEQNKNYAHLRRSDSSEDSDHTGRYKSRGGRDRISETRSRSSSEIDRSGSPTRNNKSQSRLLTDTRTNRRRERSRSSDRCYKHSRGAEQRSGSQSRNARSRHGSSSSSSSSSSGSSKSSDTSPRLRLVSSVVKPVVRTDNSKAYGNDLFTEKHPLSSADSNSSGGFKRRRNSGEKPKILSSAVKSSVCGNEKNVDAADAVKRVPVHMRLGTLPGKRVIRMTKDVEAAFVCTSSDEDTDVNMKYKKQNYRVVTELSGNKLDEVSKRHVEKGTCRNIDVFKGRRMKIER